MIAQEFTVDLHAPLAFQAYDQWVHQPIVCKESPRFFKSDFCEFLTRTVWWAIPVVWLPVVCWSISRSVLMGCTFPQVAVMVPSGMFIWTLLEYIIHRFLFHIKTKSYWGNTVHYLIHGYHHKHPMDSLRLVFPPAETAVACIPWAVDGPALFGGGLLGYIIYDCTHYYLHHGHPSINSAGTSRKKPTWIPLLKFLPPVFFFMQRYHMNHHFRIQTLGFGVTSSFWDWILETLPPRSSFSVRV
ncbi:unnamed protein product [Spirodela intermedia]|uniref:Fatty acid hydroxylase domain-containing protein n=1 Tax=Spirodela intermedia TaxID=51605 RepID=A0A7I8JF64_SPIIN|nr:unnamed protein product [Spirodela intermedia]CAA6668571.1 unnamed protein product [Spirodela intermedia]